MPNASLQLPNIDLPGAEFLALAPNRTLDIIGRRRAFQAVGNTSVPAGTTGHLLAGMIIENPFPPNAAIYVADVYMIYFPDASGTMQVNQTQTGFVFNATIPTAPATYPLGIPVLTQLSPVGAQVALRDRDQLISFKDIGAWNNAFPTTPQPLQWNIEMFVKNTDATNPHTVNLAGVIVYHLLYGVSD